MRLPFFSALPFRHPFSRLGTRLAMLGLVTSLWFGPLASSTKAQDGDPALVEARDHMERGQSYYLQGRFSEAAAEFEAAHTARPFAAFLYNAGISYQNGGNLGRAVDLFTRYLSASDADAADRAEVEARIAVMQATISERAAAAAAAAAAGEPAPVIAEDPESGEGVPPDALPEDFKSLISVVTVPAGATVTISLGETVVASGPSPLSASLDQGGYHLRIEHPDFNLAEAELTVEPGKVYLIQMNLSQGEFFGYLRVRSSEPGASVFIDDRDLGARGATPFEGPVQVGHHHIWIERPGFSVVERDIDVSIGQEVIVDEDLERTTEGRLRVIGNIRGARILVDGEVVGAVPWEGEFVAGTHRVRVEAPDMKGWEDDVEIQRGQLTPVRARLRPAPGRGGAWVSLVVGALSLGGGITCSVLAHDYAYQLDQAAAMGTLASDDERIDLATGLSIAQWGAYGLSALLLGLSVYYFLVDDLPPSEATVLEARDFAVLPMFDPVNESYGLAVAGSF